jgi:two-component system, NarL family, sensor histidine kinase BarA
VVSRQSAIDDPASFAKLLSASDLEEVAKSYADLYGVPVSIRTLDNSVAVAVGTSGGTGAIHRRSIGHAGHELAEIVLGPFDPARLPDLRAAAVAEQAAGLLGMMIRTAYDRHLAVAQHDAAMQAVARELGLQTVNLDQALDRLKDVDRLKSSFLATVSHELRTPLTSVIGYSEMLLEGLAGELSPEQHDYVRTILNKGEQLLHVITGILDVSMSSSGQLHLQRMPVALDSVLERVVVAAADEIRMREISVRPPEPCGLRVLGDESKLHQVFAQLLSNALKFTRDGGNVTIEIGVGPVEHQAEPSAGPASEASVGLGVQVAVEDSGIGISAEKQAHIFDAFFQVDSSSTREYGGTGLGLTLVKSYTEAHGGRVWVSSELGKGSRFTVALPVLGEDLERYLAGRAAL